MEFGIFLTMPSPDARPSHEIYRLGVDLVVRAEELGFRRAWLAEHHFTTYSYISRPLLFLAHLAARTSCIRLGTAIVPVPLHQPLLVAEEAAAVDVLSGGRVDVICQALRGEPFCFQGKHFDIPETLIFPQPIQRPVPVWVVVNTRRPEMMEFALSRKMHLLTGVLEPISGLRNVRTEFGASFPSMSHIGTQRPVFVSRDRNEIATAIEHVRWNARVSVSQRYDFGKVDHGRAVAEAIEGEPAADQILRDYVVFGTPEECVQQLRRLEKGLGCNHFSASFWFGALPPELIRRSMELFAREVIPAFA